MKEPTLVFISALLSYTMSLPAIADTSSRTALPLHVGGRVQVEKTPEGISSYTYSWPGIYFEAEFTGPLLDVDLNDDQNILNLIVDNKPAIILSKPGKTSYKLNNLGEGKHHVRLEKRTETQWGLGKFTGFFIPQTQTALTVSPAQRRIEFIGDSFTVGYGNTSNSRECNNDELFKSTNTQQAFGALTAKHFGADYQINASSGFGIVRNYNGGSTDKSLPSLYPYTLNNGGEIYRSDWSPQIIVIGLGTNDFSTPLNANEKWKARKDLQDAYVTRYVDFIASLRKQHAHANFILMASDGNDAEFAHQLERVLVAVQASGDKNIDKIIFKGLEYSGCHWHPSSKDDQKLSTLLIDYIGSKPSLWNNKAAGQTQTQTPVQTPIQAQAPMVVYDDVLQPGWDNWSWAKVELSVPIGNAKPIKVQGDPWTALSFHHQAFSTKGYSSLVFYINGGVDGGQSIAIKLMVDGKALEKSYLIAPNAKKWAIVKIPLQEIDGAEKMIEGMYFQAQAEAYKPYYVTRIQFE